MQCKIKKPFFGEPNRSKLKKIKKQKFSMNCKKKYYSIDANKHTITKKQNLRMNKKQEDNKALPSNYTT